SSDPVVSPACLCVARSACVYALSLHDALPIFRQQFFAFGAQFFPLFEYSFAVGSQMSDFLLQVINLLVTGLFAFDSCFEPGALRSEEHTSELQSRENLVCRRLLEKKKDGCQHI